MSLFCGIDWATEHHDVAVVDDDGSVVARGRVSNDAPGFAALLTLLAEAGDSAADPIPVGIETDRGLLVAALRETGRVIYPINPLVASRYRARYAVSGAKSDATDAVLLANIVRTDRGAHRPLPADTEAAQAIRVLARAQQDAVWARQQVGNQIRDLLKDFYPAALVAFAGLADGGRKRYLDRDVERLGEVFTDTYLHQPPAVENAMGIHLTALLGQFDAACTAADELAEAATDHFEQHPDAEIVTSFPGLGMLAGARVLAEIGDDRSRFAEARGLKAFAGSAPITRASGKKIVVLHRPYQEPAPGRRRPYLGAGIAARLAGSAAPLRRSPRRRRLEPPSPTTPFQQIPRSTPPLPAHRSAVRRTRCFPTSTRTSGLTFNFMRCLSLLI